MRVDGTGQKTPFVAVNIRSSPCRMRPRTRSGFASTTKTPTFPAAFITRLICASLSAAARNGCAGADSHIRISPRPRVRCALAANRVLGAGGDGRSSGRRDHRRGRAGRLDHVSPARRARRQGACHRRSPGRVNSRRPPCADSPRLASSPSATRLIAAHAIRTRPGRRP
jgi:hypothetical protein